MAWTRSSVACRLPVSVCDHAPSHMADILTHRLAASLISRRSPTHASCESCYICYRRSQDCTISRQNIVFGGRFKSVDGVPPSASHQHPFSPCPVPHLPPSESRSFSGRIAYDSLFNQNPRFSSIFALKGTPQEATPGSTRT